MRVMRAALAHRPSIAVVGDAAGHVPGFEVFEAFFKDAANGPR
jgi:hypothetical protein